MITPTTYLKKQLDLMTTIAFPTDENGDIDTDRAGDIIFMAARNTVAAYGENYEVSAADLEEATTGLGEIGRAVAEIAAEFRAKTMVQVINAILFERATSGLCEEQFPETDDLNDRLALVIAMLYMKKSMQDEFQ